MRGKRARTVLYLLRHAQSRPSPQVPEADWPLSERGGHQARLLRPHLRSLSPDLVFSSPYLRARQTVEPFARDAGLSLEIARDLRERGLPWQGELDAFFALARR